jgi:hypothetical protein
MGSRHCFPATILSPSLDLSDFSKNGQISSLSVRTESINTTPQSTPGRRSSLSPMSLTPPVGRRGSLTLSPTTSTEKKTPDRPRKIGEVFFIYDEINTLLLTVPVKKNDSGFSLSS